MLGLCPGWEIGRRLGGLRLSLFSFFLKEDTKRHRKTLWKSGSITIATKKKYSGLRRKICGGFLFARKEAAACMPYKPKRPCSYPGCPRLTSGRYCEEHQKIITAHYNKHQRDPASKRRYGRAFVTAISQPTHCASNASGPVKSPLPKKSTISCRCPRAVPMWKVTSWPYASGAILRLPPARVAGGDNLRG